MRAALSTESLAGSASTMSTRGADRPLTARPPWPSRPPPRGQRSDETHEGFLVHGLGDIVRDAEASREIHRRVAEAAHGFRAIVGRDHLEIRLLEHLPHELADDDRIIHEEDAARLPSRPLTRESTLPRGGGHPLRGPGHLRRLGEARWVHEEGAAPGSRDGGTREGTHAFEETTEILDDHVFLPDELLHRHGQPTHARAHHEHGHPRERPAGRASACSRRIKSISSSSTTTRSRLPVWTMSSGRT